MGVEAYVVNGTVLNKGAPMEGAYVRVLGPSGEFVNERRTGPDGAFTLHLTAATWTFITFAPGTPRLEQAVTVTPGAANEISIELGGP